MDFLSRPLQNEWVMAAGVFGGRCLMKFKLMNKNHRNSNYGNHQADNIIFIHEISLFNQYAHAAPSFISHFASKNADKAR
jgi:hypothetical protein